MRRRRCWRCRLGFGLGGNLNWRGLWRNGIFLDDFRRGSFRRRLLGCRLGLDDFYFGQFRITAVLWRRGSWGRWLRATGWRRWCIGRRSRWVSCDRCRCCSRSWSSCRRWRLWRRWRCHWRSCRRDRSGLGLLSASDRCPDNDRSERNRQPQSLYAYPLRFSHVWPIPRVIGALNVCPLCARKSL